VASKRFLHIVALVAVRPSGAEHTAYPTPDSGELVWVIDIVRVFTPQAANARARQSVAFYECAKELGGGAALEVIADSDEVSLHEHPRRDKSSRGLGKLSEQALLFDCERLGVALPAQTNFSRPLRELFVGGCWNVHTRPQERPFDQDDTRTGSVGRIERDQTRADGMTNQPSIGETELGDHRAQCCDELLVRRTDGHRRPAVPGKIDGHHPMPPRE
jgi:hypothetical protein